MPREIKIQEAFIYFLIDKKNNNILYIGETGSGIPRIRTHRFAKPQDIITKVISSDKIKCLDNYYFRKYYEARWIYKYKPTGNRQITKPDSLNWFLIKMFLRGENPTPDWINPLSSNKPFLAKFLFNKKNNKYIFNQYSKVWTNVDMTRTLRINDELAFKYLAKEQIKVQAANKYRNVFKQRTIEIYN